MVGDCNLIFDSKLDAQGGNPTMKKKSLANLLNLKNLMTCDIWRVRNMKSRQCTFTQQHSSGIIQRRLDYIFVSNTLQELVTTTEILTFISTDHSPVIFSLSKGNDCLRGKGFWKFSSSLTEDQNYITETKKLIRRFCTINESLYNRQLKWELLKFEVRKLDDFLVAMDIEKAFDHDCLILTLEKHGFGKKFILWVNMLLRDQEFCVINNVTFTIYFSLGRGAPQGDPISAFLFILALEILIILIKSKPEIEGMTIFDYNYLYSAYADDTTFFLKDIISEKHMVDTFFFRTLQD